MIIMYITMKGMTSHRVENDDMKTREASYREGSSSAAAASRDYGDERLIASYAIYNACASHICGGSRYDEHLGESK